MSYTLPDLSYDYSALEPHIDARTMEIHHTKHHQGYTDKLNAVLEKYEDLASRPVEELLKDLDALSMDAADKITLRNNGGGYLNHKLFWEIMGPNKQIDEQLITDIKETFGSVDAFKEQFSNTAATQFGSGWAWLARTPEGRLHIHGSANQDSPYLHGDTPILGIDVWEHAYYLTYQNKRADYIKEWWNVCTLI